MLSNPKFIPYAILVMVAAIWVTLLVGCSAEPRVSPAPTIPVQTTTTVPVAELEAFYGELQKQEFYEYLSTTTTTSPPTTMPPTTTMPVAPSAPAPVAPPSEVVPSNDLESMICATFGDQCSKALSVVYCESRFNTGTVGAAGERGLFQIHPVHIPYLADRGLSWDAMFDPVSNIAYAYDLYSRSGWGPWTCA